MIVVTGIGCVTGFGVGVDALSEGIQNQASALQQRYQGIYPFAQVPIAAENRSDRCAMLLELAINEALDCASIDEALGPVDLVVASTHGELQHWESQIDSASESGKTAPEMPKVSSAATFNRTRQLPFAVTTACTASAHALAFSMTLLNSGQADRMIVAGGDVISDFLMRGFVGLRALSKRGCTPFGASRDGISLGEGAAALVIEASASAEKRGVDALACIAGFGSSTDAHHMTAPDPSGQAMSRAIKMCLNTNGTVPEFVNAHGTGSDLNDAMEYFALARCFGDQLADTQLSATKNTTGHICGGAAVLELVICVQTLMGKISPKVQGTTKFDKRFSNLGQAKPTNIVPPQNALSMNCAFGGNNTAILLERGSL